MKLLLYLIFAIIIIANAEDVSDNNPLDLNAKLGKVLHKMFANSEVRQTYIDTVKFYLYTLRNPGKSVTITKNTKLNETTFDPNEKTIVVTHGFIQSADGPLNNIDTDRSISRIKNAYMLKKRPENIILMDWSVISKTLPYRVVAEYSYYTAEVLADFIIGLHKNKLIPNLKTVHLVGFSVGGQIVGVAGNWIKVKTNNTLSRITGLDPAGPTFDPEKCPIDHRIDKSHADFVQVIHCNMGNLILDPNSERYDERWSRLGTKAVAGHVDFYPLGGVVQELCPGTLDFNSCSHLRCPDLYAESILIPDVYKGCPCSSWEKFEQGHCNCSDPVIMGEFCPSTARGQLYLYAKKGNATKVASSYGDKPNLNITKAGVEIGAAVVKIGTDGQKFFQDIFGVK